jgi:chitinase
VLVRRAAKVLVLVAAALLTVLTSNFSTAVFTDSSRSSGTVSAAADWTPPTVGLASVGSLLQGSVWLTATASDGEGGIARVVIEQRRTDLGTWRPVCERTSGPYVCPWNTVGHDGTYEVRAHATDLAGYSSTSPVRQVILDNTAPTVTMTDPGTPLSGTRTFSATASDAFGVAGVVIQWSAAGTDAWATLCTPGRPATGSTWSCSYPTTTLANGRYDLRAVATDNAGHEGTSTAVTGRLVDNTVSSVALEDPGAVLSGQVTLRAAASSSAGVASVAFQRATAGSTAWTTVCTDPTAPYSCAWSTTTIADGPYDLRAVLTDSSGRTTVSTVLTGRRVQNVVLPTPAGLDVQAVNGGAQQGLIEANDRITFTFAGQLDLATVLPGWSGSAAPVTVRLADVAEAETLQVLDTTLGSVNLKGNYLKKDRVLDVPASMTAATTTVAGQLRTVVTVTLATLATGSNGAVEQMRTLTTATWTPSPAMKDVLGRSVAATLVTETGAADVDF